jgi:transcriptional regulator with XRE-family HTH domain
MDIKLISQRITKLCNQRNWSYYRLSKESGFEQSTLKSILKEKNMPSLYTLEKICKAFNIAISDFFDDEIFQKENKTQFFLSLWKELDSNDKEKVLIYIAGLLKKDISEEIRNELQRIKEDSNTAH